MHLKKALPILLLTLLAGFSLAFAGDVDVVKKKQKKQPTPRFQFSPFYIYIGPGGLTSDKPADSLYYGMNAGEQQLYKLINQYRAELGLGWIPASANLTRVAQLHARDIINNHPDINGGNMHSWSNKGPWKAVRYTPDHKQAEGMWNKPTEISNYKFNGYEIAYKVESDGPNPVTAEPAKALAMWKKSTGHNAVMAELSSFKGIGWRAMGVGIYKGYACVWFGDQEDTAAVPAPVNN